jgi:hypothetical protein
MGETLLLLSCGAASITGLVIAAGKPIRLARPWALPPVLPEGSGPYRSERSREGVRIVVKEIAVEAVLENCRALIKQIKAGLSAEKPFVNASSAEELLLHLETAAAALKRSFGPRPPEH